MSRPEFQAPTNVLDLIGYDGNGDEYRVTLRGNEITIRIYDGVYRRFLNAPLNGDFIRHLMETPADRLAGLMKASGRSLDAFASSTWERDVVPALRELHAAGGAP